MSAISTLAASMADNSWAEVPGVTGLDNFHLSGNAGNYTDNMKYDPTYQKLFFVGSDHGVQGYFLIYDEASNAWTVPTQPSFAPVGTTWHGWDASAIDQTNHKYFTREPNTGRDIYAYDMASQTWSLDSTLPIFYSTNVTEAMEFFPGVGLYRFFNVDMYEKQGTDFISIASGLDAGGTWQIMDWNIVNNVLLFWSIFGLQMYKMTSSKVISTIANPPTVGGADPYILYSGSGHVGVLTNDPVSGTAIVLAADSRDLYNYNPVADTWAGPITTTINFPDMSGTAVIATPLAVYGVMAFVSIPQGATTPKMYLYKHSPFTPTAAKLVMITKG